MAISDAELLEEWSDHTYEWQKVQSIGKLFGVEDVWIARKLHELYATGDYGDIYDVFPLAEDRVVYEGGAGVFLKTFGLPESTDQREFQAEDVRDLFTVFRDAVEELEKTRKVPEWVSSPELRDFLNLLEGRPDLYEKRSDAEIAICSLERYDILVDEHLGVG